MDLNKEIAEAGDSTSNLTETNPRQEKEKSPLGTNNENLSEPHLCKMVLNPFNSRLRPITQKEGHQNLQQDSTMHRPPIALQTPQISGTVSFLSQQSEIKLKDNQSRAFTHHYDLNIETKKKQIMKPNVKK
jgi:hypothetical protein